MFPLIKSGKIMSAFIVLVTAICIFPAFCMAKDILTVETIENEKLGLVSGKSIILRSALPVKRVSIANPEIADFILLSPHEIYITGKGAGTTNLTFWQDKKVTAIYDIEVAYDLSQFKQQLHAIFPDEKDIRVIATNDSITLSGKISSAANLAQAIALANAYAPEGKINNLVQVGGIHQVMLEVRVAEMGRSLTRRLGINFAAQKGNEFAVSLIGGVAQLESLAAAGPSVLPSSAVNALFRFDTGDVTWTAFIDALKEDGLVKILAEPTLITLSGQSANFLAGGEFPVPVPQGLGTVAIEYKPFGVGLIFTPTVLSKDKISIQVTPEVSELDFSTAVLIEGFAVPGLTTRRASTTVELADGQSFAIAGLLKETVRDIVAKFPVLGDIPILGALFRSRSFQKSKTELVIIVTPHLVKPLDLAKQTLPTDFYVEPNDFELYLEGRMEGRPRGLTTSGSGVLDGDFGHSIPEE
jgi:pilus assembly protein CpaC